VSRGDAEDILQEAHIRWYQTDREAIEIPEASTAVVPRARRCVLTE
jgi:DNA-directed RNA polymerase specialized sigma24 family protein